MATTAQSAQGLLPPASDIDQNFSDTEFDLDLDGPAEDGMEHTQVHDKTTHDELSDDEDYLGEEGDLDLDFNSIAGMNAHNNDTNKATHEPQATAIAQNVPAVTFAKDPAPRTGSTSQNPSANLDPAQTTAAHTDARTGEGDYIIYSDEYGGYDQIGGHTGAMNAPVSIAEPEAETPVDHDRDNYAAQEGVGGYEEEEAYEEEGSTKVHDDQESFEGEGNPEWDGETGAEDHASEYPAEGLYSYGDEEYDGAPEGDGQHQSYNAQDDLKTKRQSQPVTIIYNNESYQLFRQDAEGLFLDRSLAEKPLQNFFQHLRSRFHDLLRPGTFIGLQFNDLHGLTIYEDEVASFGLTLNFLMDCFLNLCEADENSSPPPMVVTAVFRPNPVFLVKELKQAADQRIGHRGLISHIQSGQSFFCQYEDALHASNGRLTWTEGDGDETSAGGPWDGLIEEHSPPPEQEYANTADDDYDNKEYTAEVTPTVLPDEDEHNSAGDGEHDANADVDQSKTEILGSPALIKQHSGTEAPIAHETSYGNEDDLIDYSDEELDTSQSQTGSNPGPRQSSTSTVQGDGAAQHHESRSTNLDNTHETGDDTYDGQSYEEGDDYTNADQAALEQEDVQEQEDRDQEQYTDYALHGTFDVDNTFDDQYGDGSTSYDEHQEQYAEDGDYGEESVETGGQQGYDLEDPEGFNEEGEDDYIQGFGEDNDFGGGDDDASGLANEATVNLDEGVNADGGVDNFLDDDLLGPDANAASLSVAAAPSSNQGNDLTPNHGVKRPWDDGDGGEGPSDSTGEKRHKKDEE